MSAISNSSIKAPSRIEVILKDHNDELYDFIVGDRVYVASNPEKVGTVAFNGSTKFSDGIWIGVSLDKPLGKNNGTVHGVRYFQCENSHGLFVRVNNLRRLKDKSNVNAPHKSEVEEQLNNSNLPIESDEVFLMPSLSNKSSKFELGDRVYILGKSSVTSNQKIGTLRFFGPTKFAEGVWAGIELDNPVGKNDGSVDGIRYFSCKPLYGLFAVENKVHKFEQGKTSRNYTKSDNLSHHGSCESISSIASNFSSASRTRVRLGMNAVSTSNSNNRSKVAEKSGDFSLSKNKGLKSVPGNAKLPKESSSETVSMQKVLKEKEQHIEQLIREREIEKVDLGNATARLEELEKKLGRQIAIVNEQKSTFEKKLTELQTSNVAIAHDRDIILEKFEEEKRKTEDLLFRIEEKNIDESDLESKTEESESTIFELNEKLAFERECRERLEHQLKTLASNNAQDNSNAVTAENLAEIQKLRIAISNLQKQLEREKNNSKAASTLEKELDAKCATMNDLQDRFELMKNKFEESQNLVKSLNEEVNNLKMDSSNVITNIQKENEILNSQVDVLRSLTDQQNTEILEIQKTQKTNFKVPNLTTQSVQTEIRNDGTVDTYKEIIGKLKREMETIKCLNGDFGSKISDYESVIDLKSHELEEKQFEIRDLNNKIRDLENEKSDLIKSKRNVSEERDNLCKEILAYHEQLEKLRSQVTQLYNDKKILMEFKTEAGVTERNLKVEIDELKKRIEFVEHEKDIIAENFRTLEERRSSVHNVTSDLSAKIVQLESKITDMNIGLKAEKEENLILITKNATLYAELEAAKRGSEDEVAILYQRLKNLELIQTGWEDEKISLLNSLEEKNKELIVIRERLLKVTQNLEDNQEAHNALQQKAEREKRLNVDKVRKLEKLLEENEKKSQFSQSDSASDRHKFDSREQLTSLKTAKENAEQQISFLNTVIAEREKKFKLIETENESLKARMKDLENRNLIIEEKPTKRQVPPRSYCDICEVFDSHDTDLCPVVVNASPMSSPAIKMRSPKERPTMKAPRLYCDICEIFDSHNTSDCKDDQTF